MSAHSIFSPSASSTWLNCPGSIKLNCGVPPEPPSVYAIHGTVLHYITEECLTKGTSPQKFLGQTIDGVTITQEDIGAVQVCVDTVNNLKAKYPGAEYLSETKVDLGDYGNDGEKYAEVFGTADFQIKDLFSELIIIDYKFGSGVSVKAKNNTQLMIYALAAAGYHLFNYSSIRLVIIQQPGNGS